MRGARRWIVGTGAALLTAGLCWTAEIAVAPEAPEYVIAGGDSGYAVAVGQGPRFTWIGGPGSVFLGVSVEEEIEHEDGGARITSVVDDSPADEAGLLEADVILSVAGRRVHGPAGLVKRLGEQEAGDTVRLLVLRDGREQTFDVELADRGDLLPSLPGRIAPLDSMPRLQGRGFSLFAGRPVLGVQLVEPTPELRSHLGGTEDEGVLVSKVLDGMPAESGGILVGDLIVAVDGEPVESTTDLQHKLRGLAGETFDVEVIRDGRRLDLEVGIPDPAAERERPTGPRA